MAKILNRLHGIPTKSVKIGYGTPAIIKTVHHMIAVINKAAYEPYTRKWAEEIIYNIPQGDKLGEARAIYDFVVDNVRYTRDPLGLEYIQTPNLLLKLIDAHEPVTGDCDDITALGLALLKSIGFHVQIKITSYNSQKKFQHVYGLVGIKGHWYAFDAIREDKFMGWEAPGITHNKTFKL